MPRKRINGAQAKEATPAASDPKLVELHTSMNTTYMKLWTAMREGAKQGDGIDEATFSRISVASLTQIAAIVGVDIGIPEEQFVNICRANFTEALKRAPKFG